MTFPQVCAELGADKGNTEKKEESAARMVQARRCVLDKVCERFRIKPSQLPRIAAHELAQMVREVHGSAVDPSVLKAAVIEYAASQQ